MQKHLSLLAVLCLTLFIAGCGDSSDAVAEDSIDVIKDMNSILADVKDEASAKAAAPKLEALGKRMKEIESRMNELKLSEADKEALKKKYEKQMEEPMKEMMGHMMRIAFDPTLAPHMEEAMKNVDMN